MVRYLLSAALCVVGHVTFTAAQENSPAEVYVAALWDVYASRCGLALEDTQQFIETLPATNVGGGPNLVSTEDEMLRVSSSDADEFTVDVDIISTSEGLNISCHVFPSVRRLMELEGLPNSEIETALEKHLTEQGLDGLSGGEVKNAFSDPQDGDEVEYNYFIEHDLSGQRVITRFEMVEADLAVYFAGVLVR